MPDVKEVIEVLSHKSRMAITPWAKEKYPWITDEDIAQGRNLTLLVYAKGVDEKCAVCRGRSLCPARTNGFIPCLTMAADRIFDLSMTACNKEDIPRNEPKPIGQSQRRSKFWENVNEA